MAEVADIKRKKVDNAIPRVMFDTNTYRFIIDGVADNHGNSAEIYQQIRQMIIDGKIEAFLSETLFTIEAIQKKDRFHFMASYEPTISVDERMEGNILKLRFELKPNETQKEKIEEVAKAFAEMSDGDSIASSIGLECFAFCTNDSAKKAGVFSVMSENNVAWLKEEYGFKKLTPTELLEHLRESELRNN